MHAFQECVDGSLCLFVIIYKRMLSRGLYIYIHSVKNLIRLLNIIAAVELILGYIFPLSECYRTSLLFDMVYLCQNILFKLIESLLKCDWTLLVLFAQASCVMHEPLFTISHISKSLFFPQDLAAKIDQASEAGEQFAKLYYETYDKKRHVS